jgi:hypothetical protein
MQDDADGKQACPQARACAIECACCVCARGPRHPSGNIWKRFVLHARDDEDDAPLRRHH